MRKADEYFKAFVNVTLILHWTRRLSVSMFFLSSRMDRDRKGNSTLETFGFSFIPSFRSLSSPSLRQRR